MEEKELDPLGEKVEDFLDYLKVERLASLHTVSAYRNDLAVATNLFRSYGLEDWTQLDNSHLLRFEASLSKGLAKSSAQRRLSSLRSFLKFCRKSGEQIEADLPSTGGFKKSKNLPKSLASDAVELLLSCPLLEKPSGLRDRALLELIYGAGLRISEAVDLELGSIDLDNLTVRILGKRGKTRINPLPDGTAVWLRKYLEEARPQLVDRPLRYFIVSDQGKHLLRQTAYNTLKRYVRQSQVPGYTVPHTLRHSFAVQMLKGGADLRVVQELLGHESIGTTQIYTQLDLEEVRKRYDRSHPRR